MTLSEYINAERNKASLQVERALRTVERAEKSGTIP